MANQWHPRHHPDDQATLDVVVQDGSSHATRCKLSLLSCPARGKATLTGRCPRHQQVPSDKASVRQKPTWQSLSRFVVCYLVTKGGTDDGRATVCRPHEKSCGRTGFHEPDAGRVSAPGRAVRDGVSGTYGSMAGASPFLFLQALFFCYLAIMSDRSPNRSRRCRSPQDIMEEIAALDAESAGVLATIGRRKIIWWG